MARVCTSSGAPNPNNKVKGLIRFTNKPIIPPSHQLWPIGWFNVCYYPPSHQLWSIGWLSMHVICNYIIGHELQGELHTILLWELPCCFSCLLVPVVVGSLFALHLLPPWREHTAFCWPLTLVGRGWLSLVHSIGQSWVLWGHLDEESAEANLFDVGQRYPSLCEVEWCLYQHKYKGKTNNMHKTEALQLWSGTSCCIMLCTHSTPASVYHPHTQHNTYHTHTATQPHSHTHTHTHTHVHTHSHIIPWESVKSLFKFPCPPTFSIAIVTTATWEGGLWPQTFQPNTTSTCYMFTCNVSL